MVDKLPFGHNKTEQEKQAAIDQLIELNVALLNGNQANFGNSPIDRQQAMN